MAKLKNGVQATSQIYAVLTDRGAELEAEALATGVPVTLSQFCIGDANGQEEVTPDPARTALINEVYRGILQRQQIRITRLRLRWMCRQQRVAIRFARLGF